MYIKLDHTFNEVIEMARERKLIQQVRIKSPQIIEIDNPGTDENPELLYPETLVEGEPSNSEDEVYATGPIGEELNQAWDILGTPEAQRKAVLGKPDLNKKELLQQLKAEIDTLSKDEEEISCRQQNLFF